MFLKCCGRNSQSLNAIKHGSSRPEMFRKKGVLRNFTKFTGKHPCQSLFLNKVAVCASLFLNKVAGIRPATLLRKGLWHRCFPVNFAKFLRTPFLQNTSRQLLLSCYRNILTNLKNVKQTKVQKRFNYGAKKESMEQRERNSNASYCN